MVPWRQNQTVVRRLRVKGRKLDPLAAQLRLENLLQTVELHPPWLPSSAIVCLRRLHDPMPRALNLQNRTATQSFAWQQAVSASVQEEIRRAARPVNSDVTPDTSAVIFKDQAELLACLAMDWLEDRLRERWWWRSLIKDQVVGSVVPDTWVNAPQYVPAALELLAVNRRLEAFVNALSVDHARALLREVTRSFALPELHAALDTGFDQLVHDSGDETTSALQFEDASEDLHATLAPWHRLAPESLDQTLGLKRQCLIGVALTIRRAPAAVHSFHFARATLKWLRTAGTVGIVRAGNSNESHKGRNRLSERERVNVGDEDRDSVASTVNVDAARESFPSEQIHLGRDAIESAAENERPPQVCEDLLQPLTSRISSSSSNVYLNRESDEAIPFKSTAPPGIETSLASFSENPYVETAPDLLGLDEVRVETQFGGIFYLVNLGLFLELYADFTTPLGNNPDLSIFDFIELVGRRLLNETTEDPVWTLLAQLSGRSEFDAPGQGFEPPDQWRLPPQWLEAFPDESKFEWMTEGERLLVRHPAGFLLLDVLVSDEPAKQLKTEMVVYDASAKRQLIRKSFSFSRKCNSLEQWLDWIVPYLRARLCRAFGIDDTSDPAPLLCRQQASICLTAVHLDMFFSLSEHPLEIRLAGLDRDPGWVPAAGRFIRFHYQ